MKEHTCPSLVKIFDGGEFGGRLFLLMERAPGRELEKALSDVARDKIRLVVDRVARAVAFLRTKNICHRDIKAANIYVLVVAPNALLAGFSCWIWWPTSNREWRRFGLVAAYLIVFYAVMHFVFKF
jgi:hypothetical protein